MINILFSKRNFLIISFSIVLLKMLLMGYLSIPLVSDEGQYWLWSKHLDLGYFSKPPLMAWMIFLVTKISGSDSEFFVRLTSLIFINASAIPIFLAIRQLFDQKKAILYSLVFLLSPVAFSYSLFISTDPFAFFFWAWAIYFFVKTDKYPTPSNAVSLGVALGLGALSKYIVLFFIPGALLYTCFNTRKNYKLLMLSVVVCVFVLSPNIYWNIMNHGQTVSHTSDNIGAWALKFNLGSVFQFLIVQILMIGVCSFSFNQKTSFKNWQLLMTGLPLFIAMILQGLFSKLNANWAVAALPTIFVLLPAFLKDKFAIRLQVLGFLGLYLLVFHYDSLFRVFPLKNILPHPNERLLISNAIASEIDTTQQYPILVHDRMQAANLMHYYRDMNQRIYYPIKNDNHYLAKHFSYAGNDQYLIYVHRNENAHFEGYELDESFDQVKISSRFSYGNPRFYKISLIKKAS